MTTKDFAYWLHGWTEINGGTPPTAAQWTIIKDHLDLVFNKVTPLRQAFGDPWLYSPPSDGSITCGGYIDPAFNPTGDKPIYDVNQLLTGLNQLNPTRFITC